MKSYAALLLFAAAIAVSVRAAEGDRKPFDQLAQRLDVPGAVVARLESAPQLDAVPDFSKWAGPLAFGFLDGRDGKPPLKTEGYLSTGQSKLYLAIRCFEPDMQSLKSEAVERDGDVWKGDSVEALVQPGIEFTKEYFQFAVNPAGSLFDARVTKKEWNSGAEVKVFRDGESWTVVLAIPFDDLLEKGTPEPALWRINLHRARVKRGGFEDLDLAWSPTRSTSNHVPSRFGLAWLKDEGGAFEPEKLNAVLDGAEKMQVVFKQNFEKDVSGFSEGEAVKADGPGGPETFLRLKGKNQTRLERNFGEIRGLQMAFAYRTAPDQHGLAVQGSGTVVHATRPAMSEVIGRGLKIAQETCNDADHQTRAFDLGMDAFLFKRPYGHCQQGNMPPTPGQEWATARFQIDAMHGNDNHLRVIDPKQQYEAFGFILNGDIKPESFLELGWIVVWRGKDSEAPTVPSDFRVEKKEGKAFFAWKPSTDNLQVRNYEVLRKDGEAWKPFTIATVPCLSVPETDAPAGAYAVRAVDVSGNMSEPTKPIDWKP